MVICLPVRRGEAGQRKRTEYSENRSHAQFLTASCPPAYNCLAPNHPRHPRHPLSHRGASPALS
jgi:hypothetical protein